MLKKTSAIVLAAASLVCLSSAFAESAAAPSPFVPSFFADLQLGYGKSYTQFNGLGLGLQSIKNTGVAGGGDLGYQFNPYLGVDVGFTIFSNVTGKVVAPGTNSVTLAKSNYIADLALRAIFPIQKFDIYGEIGPALSHINYVNQGNNGSVTRAVFFGAIGADYHFTDTVSLGAKFLGTTKNAGNTNAVPPALIVPAHWAILADLGFHFSV